MANKVHIRTYLLLGSNLGDRQQLLSAARVRIEILAGPVVQASGIYETAAWGKTDQPNFLNQAICVDTTLEPAILLSTLLAIERSLGRVRKDQWEPRPIDIDILFYGDQVVNESDLVIPHPTIAERRFVLTPMAEIAADVTHPVKGMSIREMLVACADPLEVRRL